MNDPSRGLRGAAGASYRPARRTHYPDASPEATFGRPPLRLQAPRHELSIAGEPWGLEPTPRDPGDEASELYRLTRIPDGTTHRIALTRFRDGTVALDCDCPTHQRHGNCIHARALRRAGTNGNGGGA